MCFISGYSVVFLSRYLATSAVIRVSDSIEHPVPGQRGALPGCRSALPLSDIAEAAVLVCWGQRCRRPTCAGGSARRTAEGGAAGGCSAQYRSFAAKLKLTRGTKDRRPRHRRRLSGLFRGRCPRTHARGAGINQTEPYLRIEVWCPNRTVATGTSGYKD